MTVTQINAGKQHNVVPSECDLVIDIRVNDCYSNPEILEVVKEHVRSLRAPCTWMHLLSLKRMG
jgi:acetylornithine deacetylase